MSSCWHLLTFIVTYLSLSLSLSLSPPLYLSSFYSSLSLFSSANPGTAVFGQPLNSVVCTTTVDSGRLHSPTHTLAASLPTTPSPITPNSSTFPRPHPVSDWSCWPTRNHRAYELCIHCVVYCIIHLTIFLSSSSSSSSFICSYASNHCLAVVVNHRILI